MDIPISSEFLLSLGCSYYGLSTDLYFPDRDLYDVYELDGYDCKWLFIPIPNLFHNLGNGKSVQLVDDDFKLLHLDEWGVFCNSIPNHIATFHYQREVLQLLELTDPDNCGKNKR